MTPKETALDLVNKFDGVGLQMRNEAIACALICVDEIITEIIGLCGVPYETYEYWQEVKKEIQQL